MVTANLVKELREKTGAGMMDCKKVLTETDGNIEKAIELLRERGIAKAAKKSDRLASEGLVDAYINSDKTVGVIVEVNSETDFVAKNEEFKTFVANLAEHISVEKPENVEDLLNQNWLKENSKTVSNVLTEKISTIGENLSIRRFEIFETNNIIEKYIHGDGKIAVLVEQKNGDSQLAKDICMQVAAAKPEYLVRENVPNDRVEKEMEILKAQAINEGKPEELAGKIVQGRIGKFYGEICLVEQQFVKDPNVKVNQILKERNAEVVKFVRFEKGEGLEKKEENFAEEVMKQIK